ncbi:MAG: HigA family addiction module antitoxin [Acidobacteriota bacterium]|nr:HigA family addiction module antitoxin [Acidobacteriota bacterium]
MQMLNNRKRRPTHPGVLLAEILPDSPVKNQANLARVMGVSRRLVNEIMNERRSVKPDIALRLAAVFNTTPDLWLNMQLAVDVWETAQENKRAYAEIRQRVLRIAA